MNCGSRGKSLEKDRGRVSMFLGKQGRLFKGVYGLSFCRHKMTKYLSLNATKYQLYALL